MRLPTEGHCNGPTHDPVNDWGRAGGVLRCDDGGANLEIVTRGFRNPWDIAFDTDRISGRAGVAFT